MFIHFIRGLVLLAVFLPCYSVTADDIESSRTYGKMFVAPIKVGSFPPVCVTEHIAGPKVSQKFSAMRDLHRPSILIFCRSLNADSSRLMRSIDASAAFAGIPLFITFTDKKGIASGKPEQFDVTNYYTSEQAGELISTYSRVVSEAGLSTSTVGIAVNRFWFDSIGYQADDDMIMAYVRGKVLMCESFDSKVVSPTEINDFLSRMGKVHRESAVEK